MTKVMAAVGLGHWSPVVNTLPESLLSPGLGDLSVPGAGEGSCPRETMGPHPVVLKRGGVISKGFLQEAALAT